MILKSHKVGWKVQKYDLALVGIHSLPSWLQQSIMTLLIVAPLSTSNGMVVGSPVSWECKWINILYTLVYLYSTSICKNLSNKNNHDLLLPNQ